MGMVPMAAANSIGERMARMEESHSNAVKNAESQRHDLLVRIEELRALIVNQGRDHAAATKEAAAAAAQANATIADFNSKLGGMKLLATGLVFAAGSAGAAVFKFLTLAFAPTQYP